MEDKGPKCIVFCDRANKEIDSHYAERVIIAFREQTGWQVKEGTRIFEDLQEFSKGYSRVNRDPREVVGIFRIMNNLLDI